MPSCPSSISRRAMLLVLWAWAGGAAATPAATAAHGGCATIIAGGDILLDRGVAAEARRHRDPAWPLATLPDIIRGADLAMANLEGALTTRTIPQNKAYTFRADPSTAARLRQAGLDLVTLANNHSYDFGRDALLETIDSLEGSGVRVVGAGPDLEAASAPVYLQVRGLTVAVLGLVTIPLEGLVRLPDLPTPAIAEDERVVQALREARRRADLVVVQVHWGTEWNPLPDAGQRRWATFFRENGADVVLGHHPHVVQPVEELGGRWVFYSLGNLIFDQRVPAGRRALAARIEFCREGGVRSVAVLPLVIQRTRPSPAGPETRRRIVEDLDLPLDVRWQEAGSGWLMVEPAGAAQK